jgi:hypothetical protein
MFANEIHYLQIPVCYWNLADLPDIKKLSKEEICNLVKERAEKLGLLEEVNILLNFSASLFF